MLLCWEARQQLMFLFFLERSADVCSQLGTVAFLCMRRLLKEKKSSVGLSFTALVLSSKSCGTAHLLHFVIQVSTVPQATREEGAVQGQAQVVLLVEHTALCGGAGL